MKVTPTIDKRECRSLTIGGITNYPPFTGPLTGLQALLSVCFPRIAFICLHHHSSYNVSQRTADSYSLGMPLTTPVSLPLSPKPRRQKKRWDFGGKQTNNFFGEVLFCARVILFL